MEVFIDTEGNLLVVGKKYIDHDGDELIVDCVNSEYLDVTYTTPINAWGGLVRYYLDRVNVEGITFTPVETPYNPLEAADLTEVLVSRFKADVELSSNLLDASTQAPGRKYDTGKPMYNLLPADALEEVVKVLTAGAIKYNEPIDQENWRLVSNPQSRYFAAAQRHQWADQRGEYIDEGTAESPGTNCYHLACAITSLMFKLQLRIEEDKRMKGTDK